MFERVVLRRSLDGPAITAGEIAEALLFYQNTHIILDRSSLIGLVRTIGMRMLLKVLALPDVNATYIEETTATHTQQTPSGPEYSLILFRFAGHEDVGLIKSGKGKIEYLLASNGYGKAEARNLADRFRRSVRYKRLSDDYYVQGGVIPLVRGDLLDQEYVAKAARIAAQDFLGHHSLPANFFFDVHSLGEKFRVTTNLDCDLVSRIQKAKDPNVGEYTPASVASALLNASVGLVFAGHYGGDFYTSETESRIIDLRQRYLLHRFRRDRSELGKFREVTLQGSPSVAETINRGDRSFQEFFELLSSAQKFKHWIKSKSPDESLVAAYVEDITAIGWLSRVPGKVLRYVIGAAVGAINPVASLALSAGDSFFLERLTSGWRPNHFIASHVKPFVDPESERD